MEILEFVGHAGVGKTTIANLLLEQTNRSVVKKNPYRLSSALAYLRRPHSFYKLIVMLWRIRGSRLLISTAGMNWLVVCGAAYRARDRARYDQSLQIYDQLLFQALIRLAKDSGWQMAKIVGQYGHEIPFPDLIVAVQAPFSFYRQRSLTRDGRPVPLTAEEEIKKRQHRRQWLDARRAIRILEMQRQNHCRVLVVDSRRSPEENAHLIERWIDGRLRDLG